LPSSTVFVNGSALESPLGLGPLNPLSRHAVEIGAPEASMTVSNACSLPASARSPRANP
jgi:hypothetical protein